MSIIIKEEVVYMIQRPEYLNELQKFKDKNLILIQLEGMDSWLINKNDYLKLVYFCISNI